MRGRERVMNYVKVILSVLAAMFISECVFFWPLLSGSKAIGAAALPILLADSIFSFRFWIVGILVFAFFYVASRAGATLIMMFFWIPTCAVSALGFSILAMYTYLFIRISSRH